MYFFKEGLSKVANAQILENEAKWQELAFDLN